MEGRQKEVYKEIMDIASKVLDGLYGTGDDMDEDALSEDLDLIVVVELG